MRPATAGLVIGLIATLTACGGSERGGAPDADTSPLAATSPSPLGDGRQGLKAGTHVLDLARDRTGTGPSWPPQLEITLPEGWFNYDGWALRKGDLLPAKMLVAFWDVDHVYPTPCEWRGKPMVDPGREVDGLASALANQPLRNASTPTDIVLAGFHGKYLELSVPTDIDFGDCDEGHFESWTANGWSSDRYQQSPGQVDRIWILDVRGQRLVVDAAHFRGTTAQDRAELERVVDSIRFLD